jgi:hypothetical protein
VLATTALAGAVLAEPDTKKEEPSLRMELDLVDGSHIIGATSIESVPVETAYARIDLPLRHILTLKTSDDHETSAIELRNGDRLKGVVTLGPVVLDTVFGKVAIGIQHIRMLRVSLSGGAFAREGLVLWNRLDSDNDVTRSAVGPEGKFNAGRFVEGRFGKGLELNMQEQFGVTFPLDIVPTSAGCIEFWARLSDFPENLPWGQKPGLIGTNDKDEGNRGSILHFNGNDGASNGGLCVGLGGIGAAGTAQYGNWTYARALGTDAVSDWHHYALVWNTAGIPGVAEGTRCIAVFVDGRLNTGLWNGAAAPTGPLALPKDGRLGLLCHQGLPSGRVVFDNLKIWNYAKTDFGDRTEE